jgi:hypothetical protein
MTDRTKIEEIYRRLAEGESLVDICRSEGMPGQSTVYRWLQDDEEFRKRYTEAREMQADVYADEIIRIADDGRNDWMEKQGDGDAGWVANGEHLQRSRLRVDARKWVASKLRPKKYGDATLIKHADAEGNSRTIDDVERFTRLASIFAEIQEKTDDAG